MMQQVAGSMWSALGGGLLQALLIVGAFVGGMLFQKWLLRY